MYQYAFGTKSLQLRVSLWFFNPRDDVYCIIWVETFAIGSRKGKYSKSFHRSDVKKGDFFRWDMNFTGVEPSRGKYRSDIEILLKKPISQDPPTNSLSIHEPNVSLQPCEVRVSAGSDVMCL
jgi:hypothetical protein